MVIVAVHRLQGPLDASARALAAALDITPYEARVHVQGPGGGPSVVAAFAEAGAAAGCVARLEQAGFAVLVLDAAEVETDAQRFVAHRVQLEPEALQAVDRAGETLSLPYGEIRLVLRGLEVHRSTETDAKTKKKLDLGRAILTSGLMMSKKVRTVTETTVEERGPVCYVRALGRPSLMLRQERMDYSALGAQRQLSRQANFGWICAELRQRCPAAVWDDRLQSHVGLTHLLGPSLSTELHLDVAFALLSLALQS